MNDDYDLDDAAERFMPFTVVPNSGTSYPIKDRDRISIPPPETTDEGNQPRPPV
jgi:hypothetical protein